MDNLALTPRVIIIGGREFVMRYVAAIVLVLSIAPWSTLAAEPPPKFDWLWITWPRANEDLSAAEQVTVRWESNLGGGVKYSVAYSSDGKSFSRVVASGLASRECVWEISDKTDLVGWIKVKAFDSAGVMVAEDSVPVILVPPTAIVVSRADQKVLYFSGGALQSIFACSTGLPKYDLPAGRYKVYSRQRKHWSRKYEVWMPHSLFFHKGYALHATTVIHRLGRPASHGCIRLHPRDAKLLYKEVKVGTPVLVLPNRRGCSDLVAFFQSDQTADNPVVVAKHR